MKHNYCERAFWKYFQLLTEKKLAIDLSRIENRNNWAWNVTKTNLFVWNFHEIESLELMKFIFLMSPFAVVSNIPINVRYGQIKSGNVSQWREFHLIFIGNTRKRSKEIRDAKTPGHRWFETQCGHTQWCAITSCRSQSWSWSKLWLRLGI